MIEFNKKIHAQFDTMCKTGKLFRVSLTGQTIWDIYLKAFENDPIFRDPDSSSHNCNHCNNFIRRYGNVVAIDENYKLMSLFDIEIEGEYKSVSTKLSNEIRKSKVENVFFETFDELNSLPYEKCTKNTNIFRLGIDKNHKQYTEEEANKFGGVNSKDIYTFNHFHLNLPKEFVDQSGKSVEAIMGDFREPKNVFKRAMEEISIDTLKLVKDLINQNSLLDGETHLYKIQQFIPLKEEYDKLDNSVKDNWSWIKSYKLPFAKFKNELIGVLCSEIAEGVELNKACQSWNKRVDPVNYMKAVAPFTEKQKQEAKKFIEENGYEESFNRRFATIDDIKVSNIMHINSGDGSLKNVSMFDNVKSTKSRHKRSEFDKIEEMSIEKFMETILPTCTSVEAFLSNEHEGNMVSLITANIPDSKPIFKWSNNYNWTFNGNIAGKSQIKEAVKSLGGKVDGVLRFSIMWAEDNQDNSDLDAHCIEASNNEIYYANKISSYTGGNLDIDITQPQSHKERTKQNVVENITYPSLARMKDGRYKFFVRQFSARNSKGFKAEIEFNGELYSYEYNKVVSSDVQVAEVTLNKGQFSIEHKLPCSEGLGVTKEIYGLETNQFHKVNLVCLSPNHWNDNTGNKHYFFMLDGCKTPTSIRTFHNENLIPELANHRKVLEVLGANNMIKPEGKQLSGLGYNATVADELIVKLSGSFKRVIKLKF